MARVLVTGNVMTVVSSLKLDDIRKVMKYRENELTKRDEDGNAVFAITVADGSESLSKYGISFSAMPTREGYACISGFAKKTIDEDTVLDEVGVAVTHLNDLEKTLPKVIEEIDKYIEQVKGCITVQ